MLSEESVTIIYHSNENNYLDLNKRLKTRVFYQMSQKNQLYYKKKIPIVLILK